MQRNVTFQRKQSLLLLQKEVKTALFVGCFSVFCRCAKAFVFEFLCYVGKLYCVVELHHSEQ